MTLPNVREAGYAPETMTDPLFDRFGREFEVGHVLFREGDTGDVMFVIQSGVIRITKRVAQEDKPLAFLGGR